MKNIVIFGATGKTGVCAVAAAVKKGLKVRVFARDPTKVPENFKKDVEVIKGDVLESDSVYEGVEGMDGVVIVLGTRDCLDPTTDMSEGTRNILEAMKAHKVKHVSACMSSFLLFDPAKVPERFNNVNDDHKRMLQHLKDSGMNWIAVLPPHISEDPSAEVEIVVNPEKSPARTISKWDLGAFLVDCLDDPKYYKATVGIGNVAKQ